MAIGDEDAVAAAKRKKSNSFTFPAITDFSLPFWQRSRSTGDPLADKLGAGNLPMLNAENYTSALRNQVPIGGHALGALSNAGYNRSGNPMDIFDNNQSPATPATSTQPFVNGGYQFPAGTTLPQGFRENGGGGLTQGVQEEARYSTQPFVNGGYTFPAGSPLPQGFQESGGGGLTRQVPQDTGQQSTVHFLPPGFTATTGSTGVPRSTQNDIHFLPPGFTSVIRNTGPNKQLQFQPNRNQPWLGGGY